MAPVHHFVGVKTSMLVIEWHFLGTKETPRLLHDIFNHYAAGGAKIILYSVALVLHLNLLNIFSYSCCLPLPCIHPLRYCKYGKLEGAFTHSLTSVAPSQTYRLITVLFTMLPY